MMGQQGPDQGPDIRVGTNIAYVLICGYATCFTVFLRRRFGCEALGVNGVTAFAIICVYIMMHPASPGMHAFFALWFVFLAMQRLTYAIRRRWGDIQHSNYSGESLFGVLSPAIAGTVRCDICEMLACIVCGAFLMPYDEALGQFVLYGAGALLFRAMIETHVANKQVQRMHDAAIEQKARLARWRSGRF